MRKYPLQPLHQQREQALNRAALRHGQAQQQVEVASEVHQQATAKQAQATQRAHDQRAAEQRHVQKGSATAADLMQQAKHDAHTRDQLSKLDENRLAAEQMLEQAQRFEIDQLASLQKSAADAKASDEHRRRWQQAERKRQARHEDEVAREAWQAGKLAADDQ